MRQTATQILLSCTMEAPITSPSTSNAERMVLVVDDDHAIRVLLRQILSSQFRVDTADSATAALERARQARYDIVILDIMLRDDLDGKDVMRRLRRQTSYRDVQIIAITGYDRAGTRRELLQEGFDEYVRKPFSRKDLQSVLA